MIPLPTTAGTSLPVPQTPPVGQVRFPAHVEYDTGAKQFKMWLQGWHGCEPDCVSAPRAHTTMRSSTDGVDWGGPEHFTPITMDGRNESSNAWLQLSVSRPGTCGGAVVHRHPYYATFWCGHKTTLEMRRQKWRWPDLICMAHSEDGVHWSRMDRGRPIIALGHGADCDTSLRYDCKLAVYSLVKRRNVPTPLSWRQAGPIPIRSLVPYPIPGFHPRIPTPSRPHPGGEE